MKGEHEQDCDCEMANNNSTDMRHSAPMPGLPFRPSSNNLNSSSASLNHDSAQTNPSTQDRVLLLENENAVLKASLDEARQDATTALKAALGATRKLNNNSHSNINLSVYLWQVEHHPRNLQVQQEGAKNAKVPRHMLLWHGVQEQEDLWHGSSTSAQILRQEGS